MSVPIYGLLNSHNPYIGYFHYSPTPASSRRYEYISTDITSAAELERRRQIKFHPLTGCFHFAPGKYSDLHGLKNYRFSQHAAPDSAESSASSSNGSGSEYDVSSSSGSSRIDKRVTFGSNSRDDAAIVTDKLLDRYSNHKPIYKRSGSSDSPPVNTVRKGRNRLPTHLNTLPPSSPDVTPPGSVSPRPVSTPSAIPLTTPQNSWEIHSSSGNYLPTATATISATDNIANLPSKYSIGKKVGEGSYAKVYLGGVKNNSTVPVRNPAPGMAAPVPSIKTPPLSTNNTPIGTPRCLTPNPESKVGVKVIRKSLLSDLNTAIREIENHSKVSNCRGRGVGGETVVSLQDTYESSEYYYMILEWCDGGTLEEMLQLRRRLSEEEVKLIAHQLLIGILYLHTNGIVHADIKPANILFTTTNNTASESSIDLMYYKKLKDGSLTVTLPSTSDCSVFDAYEEDVDNELILAQQSRTPSPLPTEEITNATTGETRYKSPYGLKLKICDFGLSQRIPDVKHYRQTGDIHKAPYKITGTPGFLSPELLLQKPWGRPADMWAVGVVLYLSLGGTPPFNPPSLALDREVSFKGYAWKHVSNDGVDLIRGLLQKDENLRTKASDALNHRWFNDISLIYNHGMRK